MTGGCRGPALQGPANGWVTPDTTPRITYGVTVGEVTGTSAVLWARCDRASTLQVRVRPRGGGERVGRAQVSAEHDFTGKLLLDGLQPDAGYDYEAWCGDAGPGAGVVDAVRGVFHTAPAADAPHALSFVWGGDLGGQNVCRDATQGYVVFDAVAQQRADFFVGLGDMIYADDPCLPMGRYGNVQVPGPAEPAADLPAFWAYWKYNRADSAFERLLATLPYYAVWDDHEVFNDFGPHDDQGPSPPYPPGVHLLPPGLQAFLDYNPLIEKPSEPHRLYRSVRWGKHLELFLLDARQYRDANSRADRPQQPKTMLGAVQLRWLKEALQRSDATWKVIVSSVPLAVPTGSTERGRDGWANFDQETGFENELRNIMRFLQRQRIRNHLWISTDIHFATVFRYSPLAQDRSFHTYEIDTGPLNAGVFPKPEYDTTFRPRQLFRYPETADPAEGFEQALSWFNFGVMRIDGDGALQVEIVTARGQRLYQLSLSPR